MNWLRMHHEARNDIKLETLTDAQFRVWFRLLLYASEQEERGRIVVTDWSFLALQVSGSDVTLLKQTVKRLRALQVLTLDEQNKVLEFTHFNKRQFDGRPPSQHPEAIAERVRKHRLLKKAAEHSAVTTPSNDVTTPVTTTVTTIDRADRAEQSRAEQINSLSATQKKKLQLPKDFALTESDRSYAADRGLTGSALDEVFEDFCDYYRSHGRTMADWNLTLKRWLRRAAQEKQGVMRNGKPSVVPAANHAYSDPLAIWKGKK